jgi:hypothetical protein
MKKIRERKNTLQYWFTGSCPQQDPMLFDGSCWLQDPKLMGLGGRPTAAGQHGPTSLGHAWEKDPVAVGPAYR